MATHIYGLLSIVLTVATFWIGFQSDPTWRDILLWSSGWISAFMFAVFLLGALRSQKQDSQQMISNAETIGQLTGEVAVLQEKVKRLKSELTRRNQTLDVLAGFGGMIAAKVRETVEGGDGENV